MQQSKSLAVELREQQGKGAARKVRAAGKIPGVLYGAGEKSSPVAFDHHSFELLVRGGGHHGLLDLSFEKGGPVKALVREIQVHPVSRDFVHVDLQRVSMTEKLRISVQIVLQGKPEGVKTHGGILEHSVRSVDIECLPSDIPARIEELRREMLAAAEALEFERAAELRDRMKSLQSLDIALRQPERRAAEGKRSRPGPGPRGGRGWSGRPRGRR